MGRKAIIAVMSCVFALSLVLVGCGGNNSEEAKKAFQGTWVLSGMTQDGQEASQDDIETLRSLGMEVYLNLNSDGSSTFVLFSEVKTGTWEAANATSGTLVIDDKSSEMKLSDSKLSFEQDGASLTFVKGEPKEAPSASSSASSSAASSSSN